MLDRGTEHRLAGALYLPLILLASFFGFKAGQVINRLVKRGWNKDFLATVVVAVVASLVVAVAVAGAVAFSDAIGFAFAYAVAFSDAIGFVVVIAGSVAFVFNFIYQKNCHRLAWFWSIVSLLLITAFSFITLFINDEGLVSVLFFTMLLPLFNAPLDWLSLGVTRGLLSQIESGRHRSVSALGWALIDIALALVFLLTVASSSFLAYLLTRFLSPESVYDIDNLLDMIDGGDNLSIGIWLILASTLIPTFLHFLVALAAFVSLPFTRKRAKETVKQLQAAADEAERRKLSDSNQPADSVPVDAYARRWAMVHFFTYWPLVFGIWALLVWFLSYVIYTVLRNLFLLF